MIDTWFEVAEMRDGSGFIVLRTDRARLPNAIVVSVGHETKEAAEEVARQMRETVSVLQ
jgi:hypothetical protein